ncbi:MAG: type IV toxin-antitoxin system AbiEi family antitoxin [Actinomycetota bacterium]|nr:type IV toxin-antitoxin system AbiEi family antitoxin [Actinomycetota bacterium]
MAIAELIVHRGLTELRTGELAKEIPWTEGAVSQALSTFDSQGWTVGHGGKSGRGTWRELANPAAMLDSWAAHVGSVERPKRLGHRAVKDLLRFAETELRDALGWEERTWALTTWAGLEVIAPFVTVVPVVHVYVSTERFVSELDGVLRDAGLRDVEEGARVEFWEADFPLITQPGQPSQIPVASTPRLYADLLALGGRGADAAQHLRETRLGF